MYFNVIVVTLLSLVLPLLVAHLWPGESFLRFVVLSLVCLLSSFAVVFYIGCNAEERIFVKNKARGLINKLLNR